MTLQCPKCMEAFSIFSSTVNTRQTCSNENCKSLLDIRLLEKDEQRKISIYEISEVLEDKSAFVLTFDSADE